MEPIIDYWNNIDWELTWRTLTRNGWVMLVSASVAGLLVCFIVTQIASFIQRRRPSGLLELLRLNAKQAFYLFVPSLFFLIATNLQSRTFLRRHPNVDRLSEILFLIAATWLILRLLRVGELYIIRKYDTTLDANLSQRKFVTQLHFIRRVVSLGVIVISVSLLLISFQGSRKLGLSVLTSAGIVSVLVGFAAQKTLANLLAGIQIALTQQIRLDDAVVVENEWGRIEEINLTNVVVRVWDRRRLILPITYFVETPFQNWTRNESTIIGAVMLHLDYTVPVDQLRQKAREIVEQEPLWDKQSFAVQVTETLPTCVQVRVLVSSFDAPSAFDLRCIVREKLLAYVQEAFPGSLPKMRIEMTE
ncbi:mechanosensitive ion channel family protein [Tellurirhabdus rosea]|uniref:mechanosensitive ion channel family protein n=1 Tax=Tellurirhabdus rosea TaxID=2674997 RepID=UPI0022553319|nr:mechanosensitive ion channel domain-containing protein [Tellurirhabdus rosea]